MNIYDIAQSCNVSTATVSRVLNGNPNVSEKTRSRVMEAIERSGYVPSAFARGLGSGATQMIGIVCSNISDMFYAEVVSLLESGLRERGYDALLYCAKGDTQKKIDGIHMLAKQADAIIMIGSIFTETLREEALRPITSQVPVIVINGMLSGDNIYCLVSDELSITLESVLKLHEQGAGRILYLYDHLTYSGQKKLEGYKLGLERAGLPFDSALVCYVKRDLDSAQCKVEELISSGVSFDAVIASEDMFAIAAQKAMQISDLLCPTISFNNSILAVCASPSLTSIDFMLDTMCNTSLNMMYDLLHGKRVPQKVVISPTMIERDSFRLNAN